MPMEKISQLLSTDTTETGSNVNNVVVITPKQHAKLHFAIRELQLKINELVDVVNALEIPDEP